MKFHFKLSTLVGLAVLSILYSGYKLSRQPFPNLITKLPDEAMFRLVVFGDSWSDNGAYLADIPSKGMRPTRTEEQGQVWTEWLCLELQCEHMNFARSVPDSPSIPSPPGAVVDNALYNFSDAFSNTFQELPPDLKTQIEHWVQLDDSRTQYFSSPQKQQWQGNTLFAVSFGFWDIWYSSRWSTEEAQSQVDISVDIMFQALNFIADRFNSTEIKVILPTAADLTFSPAFGRQSESLKATVSLVKSWNDQIQDRAEKWGRGLVYLYDVNGFMIDQIRDFQLFSTGILDSAGLGKTRSRWQNVDSACFGGASNATGGRTCADPDKWLFWDDTRLGPAAHMMIAQEIIQDIHGSDLDSWI